MENIESSVSPAKTVPLFVRILIGVAGGACISGLALYLGGIGIPLTLLVFEALVLGGIVYGFGDVYGAVAMIAAAEIGIYFTAGGIGNVLMTAFVLPFAVMVYCFEKNRSFFKTMEYTMFAGGIAMLLSILFLVRFTGSDIGKLFSDMMLASVNAMSESGQRALAEVYASIYAYSGYVLDVSDPAALLKSIAVSMEDAIKISLPFMLIGLVTENVLLGTLIAGFVRVKRRIDGASYEPVSKWRLPAQVTVGVILFIIIGFILSKTSGASGEVIYITALGTGFIACEVQTVASIYDKLSAVGIRFVFRILWILLLIIGFGFFPVFYGALSALFGRKGLIRQLRAFFTSGDSDNNGGI